MAGIIISFVFSVIESAVILKIAGSVLPNRYHGYARVVTGAIAIFFGAVGINVIGENTYVRQIILLIVFGFFCHILYVGAMTGKLFYLLFAQYICMASELALSNIVMFLPQSTVKTLLENGALSAGVSILIKLIVIIAGVFFVRYINKLNPHLPEKYWIVLDCILFAVIESVELISNVTIAMYGIRSEYLIHMIAIEYITLFLGLFVIYFFGKICWIYEKQTEYELTQLRGMELQKIVTYQDQVNSEMKKIRHDMKGHLNNVLYLIESGQIAKGKSYISDLTETIHTTRQHTFSGNYIIDAILNNYLALCSSKQIVLELSVDEISELAINPVDISAILDNLLDNAIEAVENLPQDQRKIEVKIFLYKENLTAIIKNPYSGEIKKKKGRVFTKKADWKNHGYGIKSAKDAADRNHGSFKYYIKNNYFVSVFMIPLSV